MVTRTKTVLLWGTGAVLFALAYGQMPLYDGNYNSYLVHGLAWAGEGNLGRDWLASTTDPFPVFSALVALCALTGMPALLLVGHTLLLAAYLYSIVRLAEGTIGWTGPTSPLLVAAIALPQVWLGRDAITAVTGGDWGWYLQSGVAMQYAVGHMFQPSMFGVLCIASLAAFIHRRDRLAVGLAGAAPILHFSYLISAVGLVGGFVLVRWLETRRSGGTDKQREEQSPLRPLFIGLSLLACAGALALRFLPESSSTAAEAAHLLADVRIPHHAQPERFLHHPSVLWIQAPLLLAGAALAWRTRIRWPVLLTLGLGASLLGLQLLTGNRTLALLFPWRVSVVLVPVAFTVVVARAGRPLWQRSAGLVAAALALLLGLAAAYHGLEHSRADLADYAREPALPMMRYVRQHLGTGDLYVIPTDMQRFRLQTGAPTFIDYKSHPYRDVEVMEWSRRIELARAFEHAEGAEACDILGGLHRNERATHFVRPHDRPLDCPTVEPAYDDDQYTVWRWRALRPDR